MVSYQENSIQTLLRNIHILKHDSKIIYEHEASSGKVKHLLQHVPPVDLNESCLSVLERFVNDENLLAIAIVNVQRQPQGIIDRSKICDIFLRPFARDLLSRKPISELMDTNPIIVNINTGIDDVAQMVIDSGMRHMVNGFIIEDQGAYVGMATGLGLLEEIMQRKQRELFTLAHFDQLTGLPNRLLFMDRLTQAVKNADRSDRMVALLFVDIDRFKFINDSLGHTGGDQLLQSIAHRLSSKVRKNDTVARLAGDEFVVILQNLHSEDDALLVAAAIAEKIRLPVQIYEHQLQITTSMGIAVYPKHAHSVDELIRKADVAMYEVKKNGRNHHRLFEPSMENKTQVRLSLESQLHSAIEKNEFYLCYQPQIFLQDGSLVGVEALLRWRHPELGEISPASFIPVSEETGLIIPIGEWVLKEAVKQHERWLKQGLPALRIAVNISAIQFQQENFSDKVKKILTASNVDPIYLELELTESVVMQRAEHTIRTLAELKALGVKLAIDDFGTGYSSLSYLGKFPIDRIKIDQSFIRDINNTPANDAIVRAIIALGESLALETIAEGIEKSEEMAWVTAYKCHEAQGYYFAKPLTAEELSSWFRNRYS